MEELLKARLRLANVQNKLKEIDIDIDSIEENIEYFVSKRDSLQNEMEIKEKEENHILKFIREYTLNNLGKEIEKKYKKNSFEEKILKSSLFTNKDGFKPALTHIYVDKNCIYSIDGYRALKYKHSNKDIEKDMFVEVDKLLGENIDLTLFKQVNENIENCGLDIARKVINEQLDKTTSDIFNIDKDYFMNRFLYKEISKEPKELYIFDFENLKIAINKHFIQDVFYVFEDSKFNVSYSTDSKPIIFSNEEITLLVLPIKYLDIDKI